MPTTGKTPKINLAAPSKADQELLAAMPEDERRAFIEAEILKGFEGTPRRVTALDIKTRVLKKLSADA